jgi:hypothetical protein
MSRTTSATRPALLLALAGMLALAVGGPAAGATVCPAASGQASCPMAATPSPAGHAPSAGHGCHGGTALAADCCGAGEAAAVPAAPAAGIAPSPAVALAAAAVGTTNDAGACDLLQPVARPPADGLYTLHRAFLI